MAIGASLIARWLSGRSDWATLGSSSVPMQFNTALCVLIGAAGLAGWIARGWRAGAAIAWGFVSLVGAAMLLQYAAGLDLGVDEVIVEYKSGFPSKFPGRISPRTSICFICLGACVFFVLYGKGFQARWRVADALAVLPACLVVEASFGHFVGLEPAFSSALGIGMSLPTSVSLGLLCAGFLVAQSERNPMALRQASILRPLSVALGCVLLFLLIRRAMEVEERESSRRLSAEIAVDASAALEGKLEREKRFLVGSAERFRNAAARALELWESEVSMRLNGFEGLEGLMLVDLRTGQVHRVGQFPESVADAGSLSKEPGASAWPEGNRIYVVIENDTAEARIHAWYGIAAFSRFIRKELGGLFEANFYIPSDSERPEASRIELPPSLKEFALSIEPTSKGRSVFESWMPSIVLAIGSIMGVALGASAFLGYRQREASAMRERALENSERNEARARAAIAASVHGMVMVDAKGLIVLVNRRMSEIFGYTESELLGQLIELLVPNEHRSAHHGHREGYGKSPHQRAMGGVEDLYGRRKDGALIPVEVGLNPFDTQEGRFVMASVVDITDRLAARQELQNKNKEMESLLYIVSHDLKAPVVRVQGIVRLLDDLELVADPQTLKLMRQIGDSMSHMEALITDLLEMSQIGKAEGRIENVDLGQVIAEVIDTLKSESEAVRCDWKVDGPFPNLRASRVRMAQLFHNLASNALKYGCPAPTNRVEVSSSVNGSYAEVYFRDFGQGIDPKQQGKVFNLFHRLDTSKEGTGVGLAIVRKVMEQYGGEVGLDSEAGKGCRFVLRFPYNRVSSAEGVAVAPPAAPLRSSGAAALEEVPFAEPDSADNEFLRDLIYAASHDFQSPLNTIHGHLSFFQDHYSEALPKEARSLIGFAVDASDQMIGLIRAFLQYSSMLQRKVSKVEVDLSRLVADEIEAVSEQLSSVGANVEVGSLPRIQADYEMCSLLFRNLLDNALKFRRVGIAPKIRIHAVEEERFWRLAVADEGIGVIPNQRSRVFRIFARTSRQREYPGNGIGLALCRRIVEAHGGKIWIDPQSKLGTTICFTLNK